MTQTAVFQMIHDIVNPETGKTYKEENLEKKHSFPVGSLVEFVVSDDPLEDHDMDGARLFVVHHSRDCDGTPLYCLSASRDDTEQERPGFANHSWVNGYPEDCLALVRSPEERKQ